MAGDDQRAGRRVELLGALQNVHRTSGARQQRCGEKTGSGAANDGDLSAGPSSTSLFNFLMQGNLPSLQSPIACMQRIGVEALHESELSVLTNVENCQSPIHSCFKLLTNLFRPLHRPSGNKARILRKQYSQTGTLGKAEGTRRWKIKSPAVPSWARRGDEQLTWNAVCFRNGRSVPDFGPSFRK